VQAADTLSAARPGARSETLETYTKRISQLEELAKTFDGVQQAYAMQAGREIRVMVIPEKVSDADAIKMAQEMRDKIEQTMTYPGQIKISIIREYRALETAK
jgi:ribonuclease Y